MKTDNINELIEDFTKVIQFRIITTIKNHYGSLSEFKREYASACAGNNMALARYLKNFHIDRKILSGLTRAKDGKKRLQQVLDNLDRNKLVYKGKCDVKYKKSGKKFSKVSSFYIPFVELEKLFNMADMEKTPFNTKSGYYTKRQHNLIDRYVFGYVKERKAYTKTEKFNDYQEKRRRDKLMSKINDGTYTDADIDEVVSALDI